MSMWAHFCIVSSNSDGLKHLRPRLQLGDVEVAYIVKQKSYSGCWCRGEGIANWTVAAGYIPTVSSYNFTVGFVQAQCTDGLVLAPLHYGFNNSNITAQTLNQKQLVSQWQYNTPADQKFYYSNRYALLLWAQHQKSLLECFVRLASSQL